MTTTPALEVRDLQTSPGGGPILGWVSSSLYGGQPTAVAGGERRVHPYENRDGAGSVRTPVRCTSTVTFSATTPRHKHLINLG
jgi:hypothetical protein